MTKKEAEKILGRHFRRFSGRFNSPLTLDNKEQDFIRFCLADLLDAGLEIEPEPPILLRDLPNEILQAVEASEDGGEDMSNDLTELIDKLRSILARISEEG